MINDIKGMKIFLTKEGINLDELTSNTIFMCDSSETKNILSKCVADNFINKTEKSIRVNDGYDWIDEICCECKMDFPQTTIYNLNNNLDLTITVENAFVFNITNPYDIWFIQKREDGFAFIPLSDFEYEKYNNNPIMLYKALSVGRFFIMGTYGR